MPEPDGSTDGAQLFQAAGSACGNMSPVAGEQGAVKFRLFQQHKQRLVFSKIPFY